MPEMFSSSFRNIEQDCKSMAELLQDNGWVIVDGVVRSISVGMGFYNPVEEGAVSVFIATENAVRQLPQYPGMARNITMLVPHVMLARKTFRYGLLNSVQIAGGTIAGINGYKLAEDN